MIMGSTMYYIINENMTKEAFINNNTFSGCLHSRGVVLHFSPGLQENTLLCRAGSMNLGALGESFKLGLL